MRNERGFTLIELVVVIVVLGILAAVAVPKFVDLKSEAQAAASDGIKGGIDSASAVNYGAYLTNPSKGVAIGTTAGANSCATAVAAILQDVDAGITGLSTTAWTAGPTMVAGSVVDCTFSFKGTPKTAKILLTVD